MRTGIKILADTPGPGPEVQRQHIYRMRIRMRLNQGDPIRWERPWGLVDRATLEDDGTTLLTDLRVDRENLFAGLFQGVQGMRIGGTRTLRVSPHLAYGERGVPGTIPEHAVLVVECTILEERVFPG